MKQRNWRIIDAVNKDGRERESNHSNQLFIQSHSLSTRRSLTPSQRIGSDRLLYIANIIVHWLTYDDVVVSADDDDDDHDDDWQERS